MWKKLLAFFRGNSAGPDKAEPQPSTDTKPATAPDESDAPYMPEVDGDPARDAEVFAKARQISAGKLPPDMTVLTPSECPPLDPEPNQRYVAVITPGRLIMPFPCPPPETVSAEMLASVRQIVPQQPKLAITAIAFNDLVKHEALTPAEANEFIPFLGYLMGMTFDGHTVVAFEGHTSAFEAGVRNSDVLIIDSAMLEFLRKDWATIAFGSMHKGARIFIHERKSFHLMPVAQAKNEAGWRFTERDGEVSYVNCLLTTLAKAPRKRVSIVVGSPVPDLAQIATDPAELDWISTLPFRYDQLNAEQVIETLVRVAWQSNQNQSGDFGRSLILKASLAVAGGELKEVSFQLTASRTDDGRRQLEIEMR